VKWDDFLPRVLPSVPGCPESLALQHIVDAARTFASKTLVWQYEATPISSVANVPDYTLQIEAGQELARILWCSVDGREYTVPHAAQGRRLKRRNCGNVLIPTGPQDFQLSPAPQFDGLQVLTDIAVRPALVGSIKWPDDLDENVTDIVSGALSTLLELPGVTWRDMPESQIQAGKFAARIAAVQFKVSHSYGGSRSRVRLRFF